MKEVQIDLIILEYHQEWMLNLLVMYCQEKPKESFLLKYYLGQNRFLQVVHSSCLTRYHFVLEK